MINEAPANLGVQRTLNKLAETTEFEDILLEEAGKRLLAMKDVKNCLNNIYPEVCMRAHGNDTLITLKEGEFSEGEMVVLIAFFRLQDKWGNSLQWEAVGKEVGEGGQG